MVTSRILVVLWILFVVLFFVLFALQSFLKARLKDRFSSDTILSDTRINVFDHSARGTMWFIGFLMRREYSGLGDRKLVAYCDVLRVLYVCYLLLFLFLAVNIIFTSH